MDKDVDKDVDKGYQAPIASVGGSAEYVVSTGL